MKRFEPYVLWTWRAAVLLGLLAIWLESRDASRNAETAIFAANEAERAAKNAEKEAEKSTKEASEAVRWILRR